MHTVMETPFQLQDDMSPSVRPASSCCSYFGCKFWDDDSSVKISKQPMGIEITTTIEVTIHVEVRTTPNFERDWVIPPLVSRSAHSSTPRLLG